MEIKLSIEERQELELLHKKERDRKKAYRINVVLLRDKGWKQYQIAEALLISVDAVHDYLSSYKESRQLSHLSGGSKSKLDNLQTKELIEHLECCTYSKVEEICMHVYCRYGIDYTVSGMTKWLHNNGFSYKKPKGTPGKASLEAQEKFIEEYIKLTSELPKDQVIEFADGVHPTMATKITSGWIRKGKDKNISTTACRTRVNLFGSINLSTMSVTINQYKTIDSTAVENHFLMLKNKYHQASAIHLFLDKGPYNTSPQTLQAAKKYGITLHHLPTYSPNLNPIERLWKVMNKYVRNNIFFTSAAEFQQSILRFFNVKWISIKEHMRDTIRCVSK